MRLIKQDGRWIAISSYDERALPKEAGFRWNPTAKHWWTDDKDKAFKLAAHGDDDVRAELAGVVVAKVEAVIASRATDAAIDVPIPAGLSLLPYQRAGIAFCAQRPNVLLADEMGLGKTIQAIGAINVDAAVRNVLVICPASLKFNWRNEMRKWLTRKMSIGVAASTSFPATNIVIINYDIVARNRAAIDARQWDMLICDEVHALKNGKAQRTKAILGGSIKKGEARAIPATRKLFLTGTPILNRPNELWTLMQAIDRDGLGRDFWHFHKRYCRAFKNRWGAWDMSGASNLDELQRRLREGVMIRRLKADVLTELPPKRRQVITLATNGALDFVLAERAAYDERTADVRARIELASANENRAEYEAAIEELEAIEGVAFTEMAKLRHDTATAKIPYVIEHLHEAVEASGKVVVFAHHHDVIDAIAVEFGAAAVTLTGKTSLDDRQAAVERFQSDPTCALFVGNILAAGVGITLTAASHVVFAEIDWRPAMLNQAEDRTHRIGQRESVLVQHLVFDESMDALMLQRILEKQSVIDSALDVGMAAPIAMPAQIAPPRPQEAATPAAPDIGQGMTTRQIEAVHTALRILAGLDPDQAAERNDVGFNKYDGRIGHSLASAERLTVRQAALGRRLVCKYHRQIGADLITAMKGLNDVQGLGAGQPAPFLCASMQTAGQ